MTAADRAIGDSSCRGDESSIPRGEDPNRAAIERFRAACAADPQVIAAFLGGSYAAGTADEVSDLDLYVVTEEDDYPAFFARRDDFVASWGDAVFGDVTVDFEGFGFDMLHFVLADGAWGEVALGHTGNFMSLHGGPHETLVDKVGLLDGVSFPLYAPSPDEREAARGACERQRLDQGGAQRRPSALEAAGRALTWFWVHVIGLAQQVHRNRPHVAQAYLRELRGHCLVLLDYAEAKKAEVDVTDLRTRLNSAFCAPDDAEIRTLAADLLAIHRHLGGAHAPSAELDYLDRLATVAESKLRHP